METFLLKFVRWYDKIGSNMIFSCYCHQRVHFRIHIRIISKVVIEIKIKRINLWIKKRKKILLQKFKSFTKFNYRIFKTFLINNCIKFIAILCFGGGGVDWTLCIKSKMIHTIRSLPVLLLSGLEEICWRNILWSILKKQHWLTSGLGILWKESSWGCFFYEKLELTDPSASFYLTFISSIIITTVIS